MSDILDKIKTEPALVTGFVTALLTALIAFGVPITDDQAKAIAGVVTALVVMIGAFVVRSKVTPLADPKTNLGVPLVPEPYVGEHREADPL